MPCEVVIAHDRVFRHADVVHVVEHLDRLRVPRLARRWRRWSALPATPGSATAWRRRLGERRRAIAQRLEQSHVIGAGRGTRSIDVLLRFGRHGLRGADGTPPHTRTPQSHRREVASRQPTFASACTRACSARRRLPRSPSVTQTTSDVDGSPASCLPRTRPSRWPAHLPQSTHRHQSRRCRHRAPGRSLSRISFVSPSGRSTVMARLNAPHGNLATSNSVPRPAPALQSSRTRQSRDR